jgi:ABC-type proline/glycine betaine transport system substrate-binding protein
MLEWLSEWLLSNANWAIVQLYHGENKLIFNKMMMKSAAKQATLQRKSKDWLAWNQDNVSEWGEMSIRGLLFQWASIIKIQLSVLF